LPERDRPEDAVVFELIAAWDKAPTARASAGVTTSDIDRFEALYRKTKASSSSSTPAGCY
jgi:hypothetical protein